MTNLKSKDLPEDNPMRVPKGIHYLLTSRNFKEFIGAKKKNLEADEPHVSAVLNDYKFESCTIISKMLKTGVRVMLMSGAADYICPMEGQEKCARTFVWKGSEAFWAKGWSSKDTMLFKEEQGFKWVKKFGCGHILCFDDIEWHKGMISEFIEEGIEAQSDAEIPDKK